MSRTTRYLPILLLTIAAFPVLAQQKQVLFIGNSYTYVNDLPKLTRQIALSLGDTLQVTSSTPGGYTFELHTTNANTTGLIGQGDWDHVVLQEQSQLPSFPPAQVATASAPFAQALVDSIRAHSPCAEAVFYMTWGRENGDAQNCPNWPPVCTYEGMQEQLRMSYLQFAQDNAAWCAPIGVAWKIVRDQEPGIQLYATDGSHPSLAGSYLAASVLYTTLFGASSVPSTFTATLDPVTASTLRGIASAVVLDSIDTWNIGVNDPVALPTFTDLGGGQVLFGQSSSGAQGHSWDLGDGGSSSDATFTHVYAQSGLYTVTYIVSDTCGRTDTSIFTVNVVVSGMAEQTASAIQVQAFDAGIAVRAGQERGTLQLCDVLGRTLGTYDLREDGRYHFPVPAQGIIVWNYRTPSGGVTNGGVFLP